MTDNPSDKQITLSSAIRKSAIGLAIFAFFTAGIISVTQYLTSTRIADNERVFEARLLLSLLPEGFDADQLLDSARSFQSITVNNLGLLNVSESAQFYLAENDQGETAAIILPVIAPEGYTEAIKLIIGLTPQGDIIGVRVTRHKETPGLGDQVELQKSDWILNFDGQSLAKLTTDQWAVKKDGGAFDQLTGATITPRALVKATYQALTFFQENQSVLLGDTESQP